MASAPQTLPPHPTDPHPTDPHPTGPRAGSTAPATGRRLGRRATAGLLGRQLLRLALCVPYLALAAWDISHGARPAADTALEARAHAGVPSGTWLAHAVPLLPVLVARVCSPAALVVVSALCAGGMLQLVLARVLRARLDRWLEVAVVAGIAALPIFWATIGTSFETAASLACVSVAIAGATEFVVWGRTSGGYAAGISLAGAVLCDPATLGCAVALVVAADVSALVRRRVEPHVTRSLSAVLAFPTVAVVCGWAFFEWRLGGSGAAPFAVVGITHLPHLTLTGLERAARRAGIALACSPVFAWSGIGTTMRRPHAALGFVAVPVVLLLQGWIGPGIPVGGLALVFSLFGMLALPRRPGRAASVLLCAALVAGGICSVVVIGSTIPALRALGL